MLYTIGEVPVLRALADSAAPMRKMLHEVSPVLPERFMAHLSPGLVSALSMFSPRYRVAALGNLVGLRPDETGHDAWRAIATTCHSLRRRVDLVGLNIEADDPRIVMGLRRLGFSAVTAFDEYRFG